MCMCMWVDMVASYILDRRGLSQNLKVTDLVRMTELLRSCFYLSRTQMT